MGVAALIGGILFWLSVRHLDTEEETLNDIPEGQFGEEPHKV